MLTNIAIINMSSQSIRFRTHILFNLYKISVQHTLTKTSAPLSTGGRLWRTYIRAMKKATDIIEKTAELMSNSVLDGDFGPILARLKVLCFEEWMLITHNLFWLKEVVGYVTRTDWRISRLQPANANLWNVDSMQMNSKGIWGWQMCLVGREWSRN